MPSRTPPAGLLRSIINPSVVSAQTRRRLPLSARRNASDKPSQSWAELNSPVDPRPSWGSTVMKVANVAIIPMIILYATFVADFGEREHVFMPARRWLDGQKAAFFSLTPAEREAATVLNDTQQGDSPHTSERQ
ncbi:hypothetical protein BKA93DRAFT_332767 [Sparassis latifolia]|uniref:Uncharacterized protein n=1 Tax=Sparassis crispa TaxID=139825 RepID=A0A401GRV5_9APHY|nr:hypothetical protein SCP_0701400 [Sparassis crispa]GBE84958.1 hypothetical protein SCP_0701400 [Sparassis crispa]